MRAEGPAGKEFALRFFSILMFMALVTLFLGGGCDDDKSSKRHGRDAGTWTQKHHDASSSCTTPSPAPDNASLVWASAALNAETSSAVIVIQNQAFVYTVDSLVENVSSIVALELDCGTTLWETKIDLAANWSTSSPGYVDGRVFISSNSTFYCMDAWNGSIIWETEVAGTTLANTSPAFGAGLVFIGAYDTGELLAFHPGNGSIAWEEALPSGMYANGKPVFYNDTVYMASGGNNAVVAYKATTGTVEWITYLTDNNGVYGDMSTGGDRLWVPSYAFTGNSNVFSLDLDNGAILTTTEIIPTNVAPAYANGKVYVPYGIDAWFVPQGTVVIDVENGAVLKNFAFGGWKSSVAVAGGLVIFGDVNAFGTGCDTLYAVDTATDTVVWSTPGGGGSPSVASGRVYTIGSDGKVYCYE